ncbi:MAG: DUF4886 domain-containing protein [Kiritimatiellia bacterium]|jgi:hypothetical protein
MTTLLRVLMIGNSFSICVGKDLPPLVASIPGYDIALTSAYIGGCSLETHWANVQESEAEPEARQYDATTWMVTPTRDIAVSRRKASLNELIQKGDWDIITIQQASHFSWKPETYQPYADNLVAYIREHAPSAAVWIQQTWAYRADDGRLRGEGDWAIDQAEMHKRLTAAYADLAARFDAPVIPTGRAVQLTRERDPRPFAVPTPEELALLRPPDLPSQAGDVVGRYNGWTQDHATRELILSMDTIHLNRRGEYLQACVWFLALFGLDDIPESAYIPSDIGRQDALFLRSCARDAVKLGP